MKTQILSAFLICAFCALLSCSQNNEVNPELCAPEKWQLVEMTGSFAETPPSTGSDMDWQESYLLYPNASFTKTRERNTVLTEESGTYTKVIIGDETFFKFTYESKNELVGNCSIEAIELLKLNATGDKLIGTWMECDGPGLTYERIK